MQLPEELQSAIDQITQNTSSNVLRKARETLTQTYKEGRDSSSIFSDDSRRLAYLGARMPATFAAVHKTLQNVPFSCEHLLDLGAGPGTASWAALDCLPKLSKITLFERSPEAISLGQELANFSSFKPLKEAQWIRQSLDEPSIFPEADGAILSYVLNELKNPEALVEQCWKAVPLLIIVEPGTPKGFQLIKKIRQQLIDLKAHLIAPCPHALPCPIEGNDWCHFSARVERTRLHRLLKEGSLGFEDEKFCYLIAAKEPGPKYNGRVIRHPLKHSGYSRLTLCTDQGIIEENTITRSDKARYRKSRDAEWGSPWI